MTTPKPDVAVFIDFENIYVSVREKFDATPNFESIMDRCEDYGRVVIARAYADWYRYPRITSALFANGIEPMYVPTYYYDKDVGRQGRPIKNSVDMHLCIDAMRTLYSRPNIQRFVLVTGDRDFIPLVNSIRQEGKEVVIIGIGGAASSHLAQSADEFLFYEQIVDIRPMTPPALAEVRDDRRAERPVEKVEERPAERLAEKESETPDVYDTLVDAVKLARKRGYVCSFGSLKVLMKELLPNFKESRYRDSSGKPFAKFTDFVREAERLGRVQIFTSGTVNEVFLPGEDPYKLSQFAAELSSIDADRELESELPVEPAPVELPAETRGRRNGRERRRDRGRGRQPEPQVEQEAADLVDLQPLEEQSQAEHAGPTFGEREWQFFLRAMAAFAEAAPFAEIFNELRELRNREEVQLTNQELKELLKQGINQGLLQRSNRGAKAHYRLHDNYRESAAAAVAAALKQTPQPFEEPLPDLDEDLDLRLEEVEQQTGIAQIEQQLDVVELEQQPAPDGIVDQAESVEATEPPLPVEAFQDLPEPVEVEVAEQPMLVQEATQQQEAAAESPAQAEEQPTLVQEIDQAAPVPPLELPEIVLSAEHAAPAEAEERPSSAQEAEQQTELAQAEEQPEVLAAEQQVAPAEPGVSLMAPEVVESVNLEPVPQQEEAPHPQETQDVQQPAATKPRRRRRPAKKEQQAEAHVEQPAAEAQEAKPRRRRKAEQQKEEQPVQEVKPTSEQEASQPKPRRRRRKTEERSQRAEQSNAGDR
ncbi:MAG: hypothetical protein KatS3mg057_1860 [Herpetosiphonaceae bacterium]|nr:MAG: hypothetical protein KatS3mg057_1860 [Herpetosiphonaceae bacterium]